MRVAKVLFLRHSPIVHNYEHIQEYMYRRAYAGTGEESSTYVDDEGERKDLYSIVLRMTVLVFFFLSYASRDEMEGLEDFDSQFITDL